MKIIFAWFVGVSTIFVLAVIWIMPLPEISKSGVECRLPDPVTEYRVIIQKRDEPGRLIETCSIEPRNNDEGPRAMMKRLLGRKHTNV